MTFPRRVFLMTVAATGAALTTGVRAQVKLDEKDTLAISFGYFADATKTDKARFPKFADGQMCSNCGLYQGKPTDAWSPCPMFGGRLVPGKAWCNSWVAKA